MSEPLSDLQLVKQVRLGDPAALEQLYDRYGRAIFNLAYRMLQDAHVAEEVVQDVFTKVWQKADLYSPEQGKFSTWILQVTRNRTLDVIKSRKRKPQEVLDRDSTLHNHVDPRPATDEIALQNLESEQVRSSLDTLSGEQRRIIEWIYFQGMSHQEITERFEIPLGTVKSRARLALQHLRNRLGTKRKGAKTDDTISSLQ